jgi:hypothetical protein
MPAFRGGGDGRKLEIAGSSPLPAAAREELFRAYPKMLAARKGGER